MRDVPPSNWERKKKKKRKRKNTPVSLFGVEVGTLTGRHQGDCSMREIKESRELGLRDGYGKGVYQGSAGPIAISDFLLIHLLRVDSRLVYHALLRCCLDVLLHHCLFNTWHS